jgi:hypothetical protein
MGEVWQSRNDWCGGLETRSRSRKGRVSELETSARHGLHDRGRQDISGPSIVSSPPVQCEAPQYRSRCFGVLVVEMEGARLAGT